MAKEPAKKTKRSVKNPETFRERAVKASEDSGKSNRGAKVKRAGGKLTRPVRSSYAKVSDKRPVRWLRKLLSIIGKVLVPAFFRSSWQELKLVTWPTWRQSRQLTFAVLVFAIVFGVTIAVVDYGLDKVFRNILLR